MVTMPAPAPAAASAGVGATADGNFEAWTYAMLAGPVLGAVAISRAAPGLVPARPGGRAPLGGLHVPGWTGGGLVPARPGGRAPVRASGGAGGGIPTVQNGQGTAPHGEAKGTGPDAGAAAGGSYYPRAAPCIRGSSLRTAPQGPAGRRARLPCPRRQGDRRAGPATAPMPGTGRARRAPATTAALRRE